MAESRQQSAPAGAGAGSPPKGPRALRIGVVLSGSIVEERLIRERQEVSIGQSIRNTFSIPIAGVPRHWPLFVVVEGGRYALRVTDKMDGRISDGAKVLTFDALKEQGIAVRRGDHWQIPLSETSRGKISAGGMTLLFQFVVPPPLQPRPQLPASVRGTFGDRIDRKLSIIVGISLAIHMVLTGVALRHDQLSQSRIERLRSDLDEQYEARAIDATFDVPETPEEDPRPVDEGADEDIPDPTPQPEQPDPSAGDPDPGSETEDPALDDAAIEERIRDSGFLRVATGRAAEDSDFGRTSETDFGAALDDEIEDLRRRGGRVETGGSSADRRTRGPEGGEIGTGSGPGVEGPGEGEAIETDRQEEQIRSRADFTGRGETLDATTLDPEAVARRIRSRYLQGIQRCHERALRQDPDAGGRVELDFTVGASGRVVRADVFGFNNVVDDCIEGLTRNWRFGVPRDDAGNATDADFVIPLVLRPGG